MSQSSTTSHPKGLYLLFFTEMWERFSYYGMRAIFTLFMTKALLLDKSISSSIYGSYTGLVYLTPLIGGYVADKYLGNRRSILTGGLLMALGQLLMFLSASFYTDLSLAKAFMYGGLTMLIIGNGFFKPNISTMVGQLYEPGDKKIDGAFTIFYMGINLGAFIAPLICGGLGERYDASDSIIPTAFKWGFLAACIGMIISTISFELLKNKYVVTPSGDPVGMKPSKPIASVEVENDVKGRSSFELITWGVIYLIVLLFFKGVVNFGLVGSFIFTSCIVAPAFIISDKSLTKIERRQIWVIYILAFFVIFFWSAFEQAGASLTYFAEEQTNRNLFGWIVPASYFQSINAVAIVLLAPLFALLWSWMGKKNIEPSSPTKQALGLLLLALGYFIIALGVKGLDPSVKVSMLWLVSLYTVHTLGELCLSPIGLSMVVKLSPIRFSSLLMGVWFLSTATANFFAGELSALYPEEFKLDKKAIASSYKINNALDINGNKGIKDSINFSEKSFWLVQFSSDKQVQGPTLSLFDNFKNNLFGNSEAKQDSLVGINFTPIKDSVKSIPEYISKQIFPKNKKDGIRYGFNNDYSKLYLLKENNSIEEWNMNPKKPYFLGFEIKNLYNFFMIFVGMASCASLVLFLLSKKLLSMMSGVN